MQKRDGPVTTCMFQCYGPDIEEEMVHDLGVKRIQQVSDSHGAKIVYMSHDQKRPNQIEGAFDEWNENQISQERKIFLQLIPGEDGKIVTFGRKTGKGLNDHPLWKIMKERIEAKDPNYRCWDKATAAKKKQAEAFGVLGEVASGKELNPKTRNLFKNLSSERNDTKDMPVGKREVKSPNRFVPSTAKESSKRTRQSYRKSVEPEEDSEEEEEEEEEVPVPKKPFKGNDFDDIEISPKKPTAAEVLCNTKRVAQVEEKMVGQEKGVNSIGGGSGGNEGNEGNNEKGEGDEEDNEKGEDDLMEEEENEGKEGEDDEDFVQKISTSIEKLVNEELGKQAKEIQSVVTKTIEKLVGEELKKKEKDLSSSEKDKAHQIEMEKKDQAHLIAVKAIKSAHQMVLKKKENEIADMKEEHRRELQENKQEVTRVINEKDKKHADELDKFRKICENLVMEEREKVQNFKAAVIEGLDKF